MIIGTKGEDMHDILRDLKKYTSKAIVKAVKENQRESRREWLLWMFERAGKKNSIINPLNCMMPKPHSKKSLTFTIIQ